MAVAESRSSPHGGARAPRQTLPAGSAPVCAEFEPKIGTSYERADRRSDAACADVGLGVPARDRGDLHDVTGVRSVDELVPPDVDADVAEPVEEDEVARLELPARDGHAHSVLGHRVVRQ